MKKIFLTATFVIAAAGQSFAASPYLTFRQTDGTEISFQTTDLRLKVSDDAKLIVTSSDGTLSFPLTELASMEFTDEAAGISSLSQDDKTLLKVFTSAGTALGSFSSFREARESLSEPGVYILKTSKGSCKIVISK